MALYPDAEYRVITKADKFYSDAFHIISWEAVKGWMMDFFGFKEIPYKWHNPIVFSDWARFWYLAKVRDTLYLDTDCTMKRRFEFTEIGEVAYSEKNICLLYSPPNGEAERFFPMLQERAKKRVNALMDFSSRLGWARPIPTDYFYHHG